MRRWKVLKKMLFGMFQIIVNKVNKGVNSEQKGVNTKQKGEQVHGLFLENFFAHAWMVFPPTSTAVPPSTK
jgi:hypothetical protein